MPARRRHALQVQYGRSGDLPTSKGIIEGVAGISVPLNSIIATVAGPRFSQSDF
jgi:hypothetical protein